MINSFKFELLLIRHGESEVNVQPDLLGQTANVKLTELGKSQAKLLGEYLARNNEIPDIVCSSTYDRAAETARITMANLGSPNYPIEYTDALREYSAGEWTGGSRKEIITPEIVYRMNMLGQTFQPPNGESQHQVERRMSDWLESRFLYNKEFHELCDTYKSVRVAWFSHGLSIKCLLHYIMGFDQSFTWKIDIKNTSVTKLYFNDGWYVKSINDCSHLVK